MKKKIRVRGSSVFVSPSMPIDHCVICVSCSVDCPRGGFNSIKKFAFIPRGLRKRREFCQPITKRSKANAKRELLSSLVTKKTL